MLLQVWTWLLILLVLGSLIYLVRQFVLELRGAFRMKQFKSRSLWKVAGRGIKLVPTRISPCPCAVAAKRVSL